MGSLASRPKVPAQPQYVPVYYNALAPAPVATPAPVPAPAESTPPPAAEQPEQARAQRRATNLLERSRGVLSTVLTGFRGVLSQTATQPRKTLLGE